MILSDQKGNTFFENNWRKHYNQILRRVIYITGNIQASEDITQEVFTKLLNSPPSHKNIEAWLKAVSTNLAYNYIRDEKLKQKKNQVLIKTLDNVTSAENSVVDKIENNQTKKILDRLNPKERLCLLLKFSGYKYTEISQVVQININSVGKTISRAQKKFKKFYLQEVNK